MAVKTITIDMEAYGLLSAARRSNESFSTVIKEVLTPASHTAAALALYVDSLQARESDYAAAMERVLAARDGDLLAAESAFYGESGGS